MTVYIAYLRFQPGGGTVTGQWDVYDTALRAYRGYVGRYGNPQSDVTIMLLEDNGGRRKILKRLTADGEVDDTDPVQPSSDG
ncbi:hypothetical protein ABZ883_36580 [Streptomyces sp. NPDC046977]|uniref:hypothetical protein n=1 Tax=Streptomyces sp. NPDC046977 TaxID=3154703 RepID=UPI0033D9D7CC